MRNFFRMRWTGACVAIVLGTAVAALPAHARKNVVTTIAQIGQPLAEIADGKANIVTLMGDGVDPHLYRLTRSDVAKINRADIVFYNGLHLEAQMLDMLKRFAARKPVVGIADTLKGRNLLSWDGMTRAYDIDVLAIQGISTESEAGIRKIETLVDTLVQRRISAVFIETTVSTRNVGALVEGAAAQGHRVRVGGALFSDAMGAHGGYTGTYLGMFDHNVTTIVRALGGTAPPDGLAGQLAAGTADEP